MDSTRIAELLRPFLPQANNQRLMANDGLYQNISTYIDILLRWNARINLTAIRDSDEIVTRHFGESLFAARHLFPARPGVGTQTAPSVGTATGPGMRTAAQACPERSRRGCPAERSSAGARQGSLPTGTSRSGASSLKQKLQRQLDYPCAVIGVDGSDVGRLDIGLG